MACGQNAPAPATHRHQDGVSPVDPSTPGDSAFMRVCLMRLASAGSVVVGALPGATLLAPDGSEAASGTGPWTLSRSGNTLLATDAAGKRLPASASEGHWRLQTSDADTLVRVGAAASSMRPYHGSLDIWIASGRLYVINEVTLETYLGSVVMGEMGAAPPEALKAQAVAARTFAIGNLGRWTAEGYDLRDSVDSQFYPGAQEEMPAAIQAVTETAGWILTQAGRPIDAFYCADGGDITTPGPTLGSCPDSVSDVETRRLGHAHFVNWSLFYTPEKLGALLHRNANVPASAYLSDIEIMETDVSKRVRRLRLTWLPAAPPSSPPVPSSPPSSGSSVDPPAEPDSIGLEDTTVSRFPAAPAASPASKPLHSELTGNTLRSLLGLNVLKSTLFTVKRAADGGFVISGNGYGHGRGMSQLGAMALAQEPFRYDFKAILKHYYVGAVLSRIPQADAEGTAAPAVETGE